MVKIALFCAEGMSTAFLVNKMKKAAVDNGVKAEIESFPESQMSKCLNGVSVVLLVPQVKSALPKAKQLCDPLGIPVDVITSVDYGMMKGAKVLENALKLINM